MSTGTFFLRNDTCQKKFSQSKLAEEMFFASAIAGWVSAAKRGPTRSNTQDRFGLENRFSRGSKYIVY